MKKVFLLLLFFISISPYSFSQLKHDNIWTIGYGSIGQSPSGYPYGGIIMDFTSLPPLFTLQNYWVDSPLAAISDKNGQLIAYTDGCRIISQNHQIIMNGDTLNPGEVFNQFCGLVGYPLWQPTIFLPKPDSDSQYYLFHIRSDDYSWNPINLMYSVIDALGDAGNGAVVTKNNSVLSDSLHLGGYVTATRHANGRDWWVVVPREFSNNMHVTLLTPDTVEYKGMQDFDHLNLEIDNYPWSSQTAFSADGSKYFRNSPKSLLVLDFDRCTGQLSNPVRLDWDSLPFGGGGVAVSPNSRFLYLTSGNTVQQYDLWATDLASSMQVVATYDGFLAPFETNFFQMMPGPDGKIYIISTYDNNVLHVIHNPNVRGITCNVEQHAYTLPARTSIFTPNFANYNLGPIDGSTCDTLGINNLPIARFQWNVEDTLSPMHIAFTDYTYHAPTSWHWDFGEGSSSADTNPVHLYAVPGVYTVCLIACNANACDTVCQAVEIKAVHTLELLSEGETVRLWPNPARDLLHLQSESLIESIKIFDSLGGEVVLPSQAVIVEGQIAIDIHRLPPGLYYFSLRAGDKRWGGRFVKG